MSSDRLVIPSVCQLPNLVNAHFTRLASGFAVSACGFSPPGASQASNPTLEALGLRRHKTGVMKGMGQDRYALHGGEQVHG